MTYKELIEQIPADQLDNDVTVYDTIEDEYYPSNECNICSDGILDDNHFFIIISSYNN